MKTMALLHRCVAPPAHVLAAIVAMLLCIAGAAAAQPVAERDGCIEIAIHSNGFHTSIVAPAEALPDDHFLRRLFPEARWYVIGWGDEDFFREAGGGTSLQGLRAAFAGGPTVLHVVALDVTASEYFSSDTTLRLPVTDDGADGLARYFSAEIATNDTGAPVIVGPGHYPGRSYFLRGREGEFHLFNNCNHWSARGLRAAGLPVDGALTASGLTAQVRGLAGVCPNTAGPAQDARLAASRP